MEIFRFKKFWINALLPLLLLLILLFIFLNYGPLGIFKTNLAPIEDIFIQKVIFSPDQMTLKIINDGPEIVTIAQVMVNDAYWNFDINPYPTLKPLEKADVTIFYPWLEGDTITIKLISKNGITFVRVVEIATITPIFNWFYFKTFLLLGLYVGVFPVLLGLLWLPFLENLKDKWYSFLLALTIGLLVFLGVEAMTESFELAKIIPHSFNGIGIIIIGFFLSILILSWISLKTKNTIKDTYSSSLLYGYFIAIGIGIHNLGEGLAIGSAYAIGEIALGSTLVIGFMIHNLTEGVAIIAPLAKVHKLINNFYIHLLILGIIAGAPTIIGALIGGFSYSDALAVFFLSIGSGAIFYVVFDLLKYMSKGNLTQISTKENIIGFLLGLAIMYMTGLLVAF